jgi:NADH dehydrogenase
MHRRWRRVWRQRLAAKTIIWAAGVRASPAAEWLGAPADRAGRLQVLPDLTVPGHPDIFAVGDTVTIAVPTASRCPASRRRPSSRGAMSRRNHQGAAARRHAAAVPLQACRQPGADRQAQGGDRFRRIKLRGALAWWIWGIAHIYFLIGLRNRLSVALSWLWVYCAISAPRG